MEIRVPDIEIRHLLALRAVAEERSFGRAAARLGFTQSAVSQQIAALERIVGTSLFDRPGGPRPVELTPAGQVLVDHADEVLRRLVTAQEDVRRLVVGQVGRLTIGTFQSVSVKILPEVVRALRQERPEVEVRLVESDENNDLVARLHSGELDLSFVVETEPDDRLEETTLCVDPFVAVVPADEASDLPLEVAELARRPLIGQNDNTCHAMLDRGLRAAGLQPSYVFRSNDNGAVQAMVRAGMGRAVLPLLAVDTNDPAIAVRRLVPEVPPRRINLVRRRGRSIPPAAERFRAIAIDVCQHLARAEPLALR
jgi:DNA-binding transcriptional LysR family regulator